MFQFVCLHFIYFFRDRVSQGWPQTFNSPASVSWVLQIDVHYHGQLFFLWESLCREGLDNLCTSCPFSSLLSWLQSCNCDLPGRNMCWGSWAVKWNTSTIANLLSLTWVKANSALCDGILLCFSSRPLTLSDDQTSHSFLEVTSLPQNFTTSWNLLSTENCTQESTNDISVVGRVPDQSGLPGTWVQDE